MSEELIALFVGLIWSTADSERSADLKTKIRKLRIQKLCRTADLETRIRQLKNVDLKTGTVDVETRIRKLKAPIRKGLNDFSKFSTLAGVYFS